MKSPEQYNNFHVCYVRAKYKYEDMMAKSTRNSVPAVQDYDCCNTPYVVAAMSKFMELPPGLEIYGVALFSVDERGECILHYYKGPQP